MPMEKLGFSVKEWGEIVGIGRTKTYDLIKGKEIRTIKVGARTIITTPPSEFLSSMKEAA